MASRHLPISNAGSVSLDFLTQAPNSRPNRSHLFSQKLLSRGLVRRECRTFIGGFTDQVSGREEASNSEKGYMPEKGERKCVLSTAASPGPKNELRVSKFLRRSKAVTNAVMMPSKYCRAASPPISRRVFQRALMSRRNPCPSPSGCGAPRACPPPACLRPSRGGAGSAVRP